MSCNTSLTSILKSCDNNTGGLTKFYIVPADFIVSAVTVSGTVTSIGLIEDEKFSEFQFNKNSAMFTEEAGISLENGSTFYTTTITLMIPRREVAKRNALALIAAGQRDLVIIVKDGNGLYWYAGYSNHCNLTALGDGSGTAKGDGSKYSLTFVAEEPEMLFEVDSAIIAALIA